MKDTDKPKKQAVIVVHGMGEQRPMETLRSFVTAVWETDKDGTIPETVTKARRTWIVPDRRNGILDLSRVTTRANEGGVRTDFFELYWADVFTGNTLQQLSSWLKGLLLRWPTQVPRDVIGAWLLLWLLSALAASAFAYVMLNLNLSNLATALKLEWNENATAAEWAASGVLAIALMLFMKSRFDAALRRNPAAPFIAASRALLFLVPVALFLGLVFLAPWQLFCAPKFWLAVLALGIVWFIKSFVVPYLGDVARYTQNAPWAIDARARIRARGLGLLRELHGRTADGAEPSNTGEYERVIVVGHSLGSVIAYDLLRYYWAEAGPVGKNPAATAAMDALSEVDRYLFECFDDQAPQAAKKSFSFGEYRRLQSRAGDSLCETQDAWKITDFVTLGCPLTHAEFLIANDMPQLQRMVKELVLPSSLPVRDESRRSFLYDIAHGVIKNKRPNLRADHGAVFAGTRWTNIFDPASRIIFGDFISGPLTENFDRGVLDVAVRIRVKRPLFGRFASRLFTHTQYWNAKASGEKLPGDEQAANSPAPNENRRDHIIALKEALNLGSPSENLQLRRLRAPGRGQ